MGKSGEKVVKSWKKCGKVEKKRGEKWQNYEKVVKSWKKWLKMPKSGEKW